MALRLTSRHVGSWGKTGHADGVRYAKKRKDDDGQFRSIRESLPGGALAAAQHQHHCTESF
jgi:hypothetical protein